MLMPLKNLLSKLFLAPKSTAFILGLSTVAALPPYYCFPILFISFGGLLQLLKSAPRFRTAFAIGYWFGFAFFALGLSWASNALLIDSQIFGWLYPISILASGAFFGLFAALPTAATFWLKTPVSKLLGLAAFWSLSEWLRSFFLTGFPWNLLGSVWAFAPLWIQSASIWGTYGLSLVTILCCAAPALYFNPQRGSDRSIATILIISIPILLGIFGFWHLNHYPNSQKAGAVTVRMVQPSIPQEMKWNRETLEDNLARYIELSRQPGLEQVDFVIWGETATPFPLDIDPQHLQQVTQAIPEHGYLITGLVRYEISPYGEYLPYNSMLILNKKGEIAGYYDKSHLVPFGEYIPLRRFLPSWIRPITNTVANFQPGKGPQSINVPNYPQLGGLICYEIIFPSKIVDHKNPPQWLVNITNDGWYGDSSGPYQHLVTTQLRAVEEGISIVRVANSGISAVINPLGEIISRIPLNQSDFKDIILPSQLSLFTIYGSCGNFIPLILCFLNIILAFYLSLRKF